MNFLFTGYSYSQGGLFTDPAVPIQDADLEFQNIILAYANSFNLGGRSSKFSVMIPYACVSGSAKFAGDTYPRDISGFADPRFELTVNFFGAPALSLKEFEGYKPDLIVGGSLQVTPPIGQYDSTKLVNIGTNRWSVKPEIGVSKTVGSLTAELAAGATLFSNNKDFFEGHTLEIDPIYSIQGHVIYNFKSGIWCALDGTYYWGGETTIDSVKGDTLQENTRIGATFSFPINRRNSVKLNTSSEMWHTRVFRPCRRTPKES